MGCGDLDDAVDIVDIWQSESIDVPVQLELGGSVLDL